MVLVFDLFLASCSAQQTYQEAPRLGPDVAVEVKTLVPDVPAFFTYHYRGKKINFFVMQTVNGVDSFLDACASCYPSKLGYRVDHGQLACRKCDVRYSLSDIKKGFG